MRIGMIVTLLFSGVVIAAEGATAATPEEMLGIYRAAAATAPGFRGFSSERGREFYLRRRNGPNGEHACASCHGPDPTRAMSGHSGEIRAECPACHITPPDHATPRPGARTEIRPLAPAANPARFTDPDRTELWFDVNCFYVLGRTCTAAEKGDLLEYLLSLGTGAHPTAPATTP
jgi:hypothetical protein